MHIRITVRSFFLKKNSYAQAETRTIGRLSGLALKGQEWLKTPRVIPVNSYNWKPAE